MIAGSMGFVMDARLVAWARAVKARQARHGRRVTPLWLFTDATRLPDPLPAVAALPKGLAGVVFRHDGVAGRSVLARQVARLCRARRLPLVVAGDSGLAHDLRAGTHLRGGRGPIPRHRCCIRATSSAHGVPDAIRARRAGADLVFVSPAFPTASHPSATTLGTLRWALIVRRSVVQAAALGGVGGDNVRRLPPALCVAAGAIGALRV
jgi:thiamine-phosphate pyrophosphorylase